MPSEFDFIKEIQEKAAAQSAADLVVGIGDDAAVWRERSGRESLITVDLLVEDVDFKLEYAPPRWIGHKALAVSLSDIAAMGGKPKFALLTLAIPPNLKSQISNPESETFWEEFFSGYFTLAEKHGVRLIGGDISAAPDRLMIDSIVIGHCDAGKSVRRNGAKAGDVIYVTGSVGASAAGLKLLLGGERVKSEEESLQQSAIHSHLRPEPRVEFGWRLGAVGLATAMIDVSDGLAQDLAHICEDSSIAATIDFDAVPVAQEVGLVTATVEEGFEFAVSGGEDFELLFTADRNHEIDLMNLADDCQLRLTRIGETVSTDGRSQPVAVRTRNGEVKPLSIRGYDHFANR